MWSLFYGPFHVMWTVEIIMEVVAFNLCVFAWKGSFYSLNKSYVQQKGQWHLPCTYNLENSITNAL